MSVSLTCWCRACCSRECVCSSVSIACLVMQQLRSFEAGNKKEVLTPPALQKCPSLLFDVLVLGRVACAPVTLVLKRACFLFLHLGGPPFVEHWYLALFLALEVLTKWAFISIQVIKILYFRLRNKPRQTNQQMAPM